MRKLIIVIVAAWLLTGDGSGNMTAQDKQPAELEKSKQASEDAEKEAKILVEALRASTNVDSRAQAAEALIRMVKKRGAPGVKAVGDALAQAIKEEIAVAANPMIREKQKGEHLDRVDSLARVVSRIAQELNATADSEISEKQAASEALVTVLRKTNNKYLREQAAEALEKMEIAANTALPNAIRDEFAIAANATTTETDKAEALERAGQIATILGRMGGKLAIIPGAKGVLGEKPLIGLAENKMEKIVEKRPTGKIMSVSSNDEKTKLALLNARGAAIKALGRIYVLSAEQRIIEQSVDRAKYASSFAQDAATIIKSGSEDPLDLVRRVADGAAAHAAEAKFLAKMWGTATKTKSSYVRSHVPLFIESAAALRKQAKIARDVPMKVKAKEMTLKEAREIANTLSANADEFQTYAENISGFLVPKKAPVIESLRRCLDENEHFTVRMLAAEALGQIVGMEEE